MGGSSMWQGACVTVHSRSNSAGDDIVTCANQNVLLSGACPPRKLMLLRGGQGRMHACMHTCRQHINACTRTHTQTHARARALPKEEPPTCVLHLAPSVPDSSSGLQKYTQRLST